MFYKKAVLKIFAIFTEKHLFQSLFLNCNFIKKETLAKGFSCEFCKISKNSFFTEHLWMTASILQQLLALYFAIIYSWQVSSRKFKSFSLTNACLPCRLHQAYAVYFEKPTVFLVRKHLNTMLSTNFENLNSILYFFQETLFSSFDGLSNYLYLFKNKRQTFAWPEDRPSFHLRVSKIWFGSNIKHLSEPFFADFCCREDISCFLFNFFCLHY